MLRARLSVFLAATLLVAPTLACINETGTNRRGEHILRDEPAAWTAQALVTPKGHRQSDVGWARDVIKSARETPNYDNLNELAVVLMRFGRPKEAAALLETVEKRFPGHWQTAPNLGTAYELAGDDRNALQWIREGIHRNPMDHGGTEWLHVMILETKIAQRPHVLGLDFGAGPLPAVPKQLPAGNDGNPVTLDDLKLALNVQTRERAQFVRAPNAVMADLLFDHARLQFAAGTMEVAKVYYDAAERYGQADRAAIARGRAEADRVIAGNPPPRG